MGTIARYGRRRQQGFTLIELMIVLIIVALLLTMGVPGMISTHNRNAVSSKLNELLGALQIARSEAVTRNSRVSFCFMDAADSSACDAAGSLQTGWIVFADPNGDAVIDLGEEIIATSDSPADDFDFATGAITAISYNAMGSANVTGSLTVCRGADYAGLLTLDATGRASTSKLDACP